MTPEQVALLVALVEIIWIDIVLSGDNAVVIGLAVARLPDGVPRFSGFGAIHDA